MSVREAAKPYRPSTGTEGEWFITRWCCECERDKDHDCPIVANTFVYSVDDPRYPKEWIYTDDGAECTAFVERGKPAPELLPPNPNQGDLFEAAQEAKG